MRRFFIVRVLPTCFCLIPLLAALLVAVCFPREAMVFFLSHLSPMDLLILGLGAFLFSLQLPLCWRTLQWQGRTFDESTDRWINHLAQAAEWFPMLGLLGTVGGILQTFSSITGSIEPHVIIQKYAPAVTATGAGLFMAFINILPPWIVLMGRELILSLAGAVPPTGVRVMIEMPRRSVTRFFIPMIDVLLLLFCIFLLMPIVSEGELEKSKDSLAEQTESTEVLERELERRTKELRKFEDLRPKLDDVAKLQQEIEKLKNLSRLGVQHRTAFHIIDVDGKTGEISFFDPTNTEQPRLIIHDARTADLLVQRHLREALGKEVYYYFLYPRPETGFPQASQERDYRKWFAKAANSLQEARP